MNGIDTNVLLRLLLRDDPEQAALAERFVQRCMASEEACFINRIVLAEAVWVLQTGYRYSRADVAAIIDNLLRTREFTVENAQEVRRALQDYCASQADFADCLIGHTNLALGCRATATFDMAASKIGCFVALT